MRRQTTGCCCSFYPETFRGQSTINSAEKEDVSKLILFLCSESKHAKKATAIPSTWSVQERVSDLPEKNDDDDEKNEFLVTAKKREKGHTVGPPKSFGNLPVSCVLQREISASRLFLQRAQQKMFSFIGNCMLIASPEWQSRSPKAFVGKIRHCMADCSKHEVRHQPEEGASPARISQV